ncbi:hypothetical protein, partial [Listeria monocytogenes]|uniref:hypothetical protein n=1 Tax=Listeria monocytogenes TaxID=1639 RepID=UPI003F66DBCA
MTRTRIRSRVASIPATGGLRGSRSTKSRVAVVARPVARTNRWNIRSGIAMSGSTTSLRMICS